MRKISIRSITHTTDIVTIITTHIINIPITIVIFLGKPLLRLELLLPQIYLGYLRPIVNGLMTNTIQKNNIVHIDTIIINRKNTIPYRKNTIRYQQNTIRYQKNTTPYRKNTIRFQKNTIRFQKNTIRYRKSTVTYRQKKKVPILCLRNMIFYPEFLPQRNTPGTNKKKRYTDKLVINIVKLNVRMAPQAPVSERHNSPAVDTVNQLYVIL